MAGMTRKDFQAIADVLKDNHPIDCHYFHAMMNTGAAYHWEKLVIAFGDMCASQNGRFDRGRFENACGYDWNDFHNSDTKKIEG